MDQKLSQYISALNAEADGALKGSDTDLVPVIEDLSSFCNQLISDQDISFASALVFDKVNGIFCIVDKLTPSRNRTVQKAREKCLLFLAEFLNGIGQQRASFYASFIKDNALRILRIDETRSVQAAALSPLIALFESGILRDGHGNVTMDWSTAELLLAQFRKAKTSGSLKSNILVTLGYAIEFYPLRFDEENVMSVLTLCLNTLEEQLHQSGRDIIFILIAGAVKCLDSLLQWFDDTLPPGGTVENAKRAYAYVEQVIHYREDIKRYEVVRAGLRLLSRHAWRFRLALFKNSLEILNWLQSYCTHGNASLRSAALPAYDQFISEISNCLVSEDQRVKDPDRIYKALMKHVLSIMESRMNHPKLVSLAIRAIGKLSRAIVKYSGKDSLEQAFQRLVPFVGTYSRGGDAHEELGYSVTVVGAFANIVLYIERVDEFMVSLITEVTGRIFYQFPSLFPKQRQAIYTTLSSLFKAFYLKENLFSMFLMNVVWSSLDRATETEINSETVNIPLWKSYAELWCQLLDFVSDEKHHDHFMGEESSGIVGFDVGVGSINSKELQTMIFDSLIRGIMKALMELNLKYRVRAPDRQALLKSVDVSEQEMIEPEAEGLIEPLDKRHMLKYLNLVEFILQLLSSHHAPLLLKWISPFSRCLIDLSRRYPLISGFYKLLAAVIRIGDAEGYFKLIDKNTDEVSSLNRDGSYDLIRPFLHEVLITSRRYKLELLASCLHLCLSSPPALMDIASILRPLKLALKIGLRYYPLANIALDALQRWHKQYPKELQKHLHEVGPYLGDYLFEISKSGVESMNADIKNAEKEDSKKVANFEAIQVRVQQFVGQIGAFGHFLVPDINFLQASGTGGLAWDMLERVKFTVPLRDEKLDVWLDCLLPRLVELAISSNDRKTKVMSSELLHALCLLLLGNAAKGPVRKKNDETHAANYERLYRKLFPAILRLATDVEPVTHQLFSEFSMQLIHWMTSNTQKENPETMALLDAILEGLVDADNGSLREFTAGCFVEFLRWSIRHAPPEASNFVNVTSMLRRLYNRMDHPNPYHRLGASMAAHQIYTILRENPSIVDRHIFEITFFLVKSLRVGDADSDQIGTIKQVNRALDGLQKLISRSISSLQKTRKDRALFSTLEDFIDWLFDQTSSHEGRCRSKCMGLLDAICLALPGGSCAHWFREKYDSLKRLQIFASLFNDQLAAALFSAMGMREFSAAVHWLLWSLSNGLITMDEIGPIKVRIFSIINHFIQGLPSSSLRITHKDSAILHLMSLVKNISCIRTGSTDTVPGSLHDDQYNKEEVIGALLPLNDDKFQDLLCLLLFQPAKFTSFAPESKEAEELRRLVASVLWVLTQISSGFKSSLVKVLQGMLDGRNPELDVGLLKLDQITEGRLCDSLNLVKAYQHLHTVGVLVLTLGRERSKQISEHLLLTVYNINKELPPLLEPLVLEMLCLSLALGVEIDQVLELVLDKRSEQSEQGGSNVTPGARFYLNFRKVIVQQVKFFYKKCLPILVKESAQNATARLLLHAVLDEYLNTGNQGDTITRGSFVDEFLLHLGALRPCCSDQSSLTDKQFVIAIIHKLLLLDKKAVISASQPSFQFIVELLFTFLSPNTLRVGSEGSVLRSNVLLLVPFFLESLLDKDLHARLIDSLISLVTHHLLVQETDLPPGSKQRNDYLRMLDLLTQAVISSKSLNALEVLFPFLQNPTSLSMPPVSEALRSFAQNVGDNRVAAYNVCLDVVRDVTKLPRLRKAVMEYLFIPLICSSPSDVVVEWYTQRIREFMDPLGKPIIGLDIEKEQELLLTKINCYTLLELLFTQVEAKLIKEKITPLVSNQQLMKLASSDSRGKNDPKEYLYQENVGLWRELHVAGYTCLAAVVMCTQEQEKIFTILFKDFAGNPLWQHLIDCSKVYSSFPVETTTLGEAHSIVKGIRASIKETKVQKGNAPMTLSSQYLVGMSMTQEPAVISTFVGRGNDSIMASVSAADEDLIEVPVDNESRKEENVVELVALDQDDFDQHPCMGVILKLIEQLHYKFGGINQGMPEWMKSIQATLDNSSTHANVRLFLGKVVVKARRAFAPFAGSFFQPLANVILHDPEKTGGCRFHYLLRDICITILQWKVTGPPDKYTASRFLNHLVTVAAHESSQVLRANIEIIKAFMDVWKEHVSLDRRLILSYLQAGGKSINVLEKQVTIQKSVGLQLFGAAVSSSFSFSRALASLEIAKEEIYEVLLSNLKFKVKEVYLASAEVLGMAFKERSDTDLSAVERKFRQQFMVIFKEGDYSRCLLIMDRMTLQFPPFLESYIHLMIDLLPRLHGVSKATALDILLRDPSCVTSHFSLVISFLSKLLLHRDANAQLKSLQLLSEVVKRLTEQSIIEKVIPVICDAFAHYDSEESRLQFHQILMFLYETKNLIHDIRVNRHLLMGLCDTSDAVRQSLQIFWDSQLSENLLERFSQILKQMHHPEFESHWPKFTDVLLLKLCRRSVDYGRPIFNAPLSDCEFHERLVDSSGLGGSLPMTPLFSETASLRTSKESQVAEANASMASVSVSTIANHRRGGMLRATMAYSPSITMSESTDELGAQTPSASDGSSSIGMVLDPVTKLKRRLYHSKEARSGTITNVLNANRKRKALDSLQALERANKVHIMRQYRTGELPDIEIKHEDIIGPMASLAERDATFARLLLSVMFGALWQNDAASDIKLTIRNGFVNALERTHNDISFVRCIEDMCLVDKEAWIKPQLLGTASLKSQNFHAGILLLENQIIHGAAPIHNSGTMRHKENQCQGYRTTEEAWLELAHLYKALGEDDFVLSFYLNRLTKHTITHQALQSQVRGDTDRALILYDKAINQFSGTEISKVEEEFWYNQRLSCLADLTRWSEVMEDTLLQVESESTGGYDLQKLWHPKLQDPYLSLFVKGSLKVPAHQSLLTEFLQTSAEDPVKKEVLSHEFGTQLATCAVVNDEMDRARFYVSECYKSFRMKWSILHPLATGARHSQIRLLQKTFELNEFIEFLSRPDWSNISRLLCEWRQRWPSSDKDDVEAWDDIVQNRIMFLQKFQGHFNKQPQTSSESASQSFSKQLDAERACSFYEACRGVMKQGAYTVAQKYMNEYMAVTQRIADRGGFNIKFFKRLVKLRCLQALRASEIGQENAVTMLEQVLEYVQSTAKKPVVSGSEDGARLLMLLEANVSAQLGRSKLGLLSDGDLDRITLDQCLSLFGSAFRTYTELLHTAIRVSSHDIARVSFRFGCFCDELLKTAGDSKWSSEVRRHIEGGKDSLGLPDASAYPEVIVTNMLRTLALDSSIRPQHAVARILSLVGQHEETHTVFAAHIRKIPSWIFLVWLPQILALVDKKEGFLFVDLLEDIAEHYPQALYFPFHVSKDEYGPVGLDRTRKLACTLRSPLLEGFIRALEDLTFPEKRLYDGLSQIKACLMSGNPKGAQEAFQTVYSDCLDVNEMRDGNRQAGEYNVKFAKDYSKRVLKALGENGNKLLNINEKSFSAAVNDVLTNLQKAVKDLPGGKLSLASFSKWMANFDQAGGSSLINSSSKEMIEIPGQYDGLQKPDLSTHIVLAGFDETLISLSSKQRPKILTMRGSDEKDYKFIVKGGEDLRLDQRIEQLFAVMNSVLKEDASCSQRQLSMRTYSVIPVSKQCGLLQFVENTCVLEDIIKDGLSCQLPVQTKRTSKDKATTLLTDLRLQYQQWVEKKGGSKNLYDCYKNLYRKVKHEEIEQKLNSLASQVPWDALKTGICKLTTSAESFLTMRAQFARSLAVLSICGYIAGVGDRHLANTLVDMRTGSLVSIDFGYSFGTGVILLPVPELIPFRLTPQLTNVLLPLDALGLLRNDMVRTMSALHGNREVISAVMDVFVKEPLVDWKNEALKTAHLRVVGDGKGKQLEADYEGEDGSQEVSPEQHHVELKVEIAHRKLDLWNPAEVTIGELQTSVHADKPYMPALEAAVRGDPDRNFRRKVNRKICSSVQEQVDSLIDQATDPSLLGRLWVGWQPWV